ncbi:MAG: hypothetical protein DI585_02020 [Pseudomonas fluorescens]|nr:MAG: hypothetical protein DI585_02020 [Pseudomonas fluorescens]
MPEIFANSDKYPVTPDGRYFVVKGRLWRCANPDLDPDLRDKLTFELMKARRDVKAQKKRNDVRAEKWAHAEVNRVKIALGERGAVWWTDGAPDYNRHKAMTTPYAEWYKGLGLSEDTEDEAE